MCNFMDAILPALASRGNHINMDKAKPRHHIGESGLRSTSVGDLYPWTIVVRKSPAASNGLCIPVHCINGRRGPGFQFYSWATSFDYAHAAAERWIVNHQ